MALYYSEGRISDMSEVKSGKTESGYEWQRMTLTLEVPGINGSVYKQVFNLSGDHVNQALLFSMYIVCGAPDIRMFNPANMQVEDLNPANHDDLPWDL